MFSLHKNLLQLTQPRVQIYNLLMKPRFHNLTMDHTHALNITLITTDLDIHDTATVAHLAGKELQVLQLGELFLVDLYLWD